MAQAPTIVWLRNDLRLRDHRALAAAAARGGPVIPVYILDDETAGQWKPGAASRWWLHHSLAAHAERLAALGSRLVLRRGPALEVLSKLIGETGADEVVAIRAYEPWSPGLEKAVHAHLEAKGVAFKRYPGGLLFEPEVLRTHLGDPFQVFTPFWRAALALEGPRGPMAAPERLEAPARWPKSEQLGRWGLLPTKPDWAGGLRDCWTPGEAAALARLDAFLEDGLSRYPVERDRPDRPSVSRLSPHLHFGEVSPATVWHRVRAFATAHATAERGADSFLRELGWREFSMHLLFHVPTLPEKPFKEQFAAFPWAEDPERLDAWKRGKTGYPIVDAGMRELWTTGYMHNRVRMVVASFLVKDLLISWTEGEAWFWDTLVDADLANNAASWQWVAGSGADAAPYFRHFNPVRQGATHDPDGAYVRKWVPELGRLSAEHIHAPWLAPPDVLAAAGVRIGETYPAPLVDHREARDRALAAYAEIKGGR